MKHPTDDRLRAYLDGELPLAAAAQTGKHLSLCADCSATAAELRETAEVFAGAMARMDALEPARWSAGGAELPFLAAAAGERGTDAPADAPYFSRSHRGIAATGPAIRRDRSPTAPRQYPAPQFWRWAAGIALAIAVGGSAAIATGLVDLAPEDAPPAEPAVTTQADPAPGGGVFARPVEGAMEVVLTRAPAGSRVVVGLADVEDVLVEVAGAPEARVLYRDGEDRVVANLADRTGVVRVTMPRGLRSATIVWQGRIVVQVAEGTVTPAAAAAEGVVLDAQR